MKPKALRDLNKKELDLKLMELKSELFNLRFQNATSQLDNPMKIVQVRKEIARINTILRELEIKASV